MKAYLSLFLMGIMCLSDFQVSAFEACTCTPGPRGPQGPPGNNGAPGVIGATGATGATGTPGANKVSTPCPTTITFASILMPPLGSDSGTGNGFTYTATTTQVVVTFTNPINYTVVASPRLLFNEPVTYPVANIERTAVGVVTINLSSAVGFVTFAALACNS
ncbi:MAG: hypothetical protein CK425_13015 [Parachlamydia sp.]|nr:MAG: hypothetical protein CK425_13015 [Parachlamydia sp.]